MHIQRIYKLDKIYIDLEYPEIKSYLQTKYNCQLMSHIDEYITVLKFENDTDYLDFMLEWN